MGPDDDVEIVTRLCGGRRFLLGFLAQDDGATSRLVAVYYRNVLPINPRRFSGVLEPERDGNSP
jgi:hypothetical protein